MALLRPLACFFLLILFLTSSVYAVEEIAINQSNADSKLPTINNRGQTFTTVSNQVSISKINLMTSSSIPSGWMNVTVYTNTTKTILVGSSNITDGGAKIFSFPFSPVLNVTPSTGGYYFEINVENDGNYFRHYQNFDEDVYAGGNETFGGGINTSNDLWFQVYMDFPLNMTSPENESTINFTYPPMTNSVNFIWTPGYDTNFYNETTHYNLQVAKDQYFNLLSVDTTISANNSIQSLTGDTYWWRVRSYDQDTEEYGQWTVPFTFVLSPNNTASGNGVQGVVYEILSGVQSPMDEASIFIYNDTWSSTQIAGSNGYYLFTGLDGTYYIIASKDKYDNSELQIVNITAGILTQNILLKPETSPVITDIIYGTFTVKSVFGSPYSAVTITLYKDEDVIAYKSGNTDSKGQAVFEMRKGQYYRVVLTGSVSMTTYVWGGEEDYRITIFAGFPSGGNKYDDITANLTVTTVNATYSNLTLIYSDSTNGTSQINFYATNITSGESCARTSGVSVITLNCTVLASGTYQFGFNATTSTYGFIQQDKIINFDVGTPDTPLVDIGVSTTYAHWISVILLILTAALFSGKYVRYGAVIVPLFGLGLWGIGWFNINILLVTIALCVGIMVYMRSSESKVAY